jgi:hypothetical protein
LGVPVFLISHGGGGDYLDVEIGEREACGGADPFEPTQRAWASGPMRQSADL